MENLKGARREVSQALAEEAHALVLEGFELSEDPYGEKWKDLEHRNGKPLEDTLRMRNAFHVESATEDEFTVAGSAEYTAHHQFGTKDAEGKQVIPPRKMLPDDGDLPHKWEERFTEVVEEMFTDILEG